MKTSSWNNKGRTRSCLKVWGDQIKRNKRKRQHDQDTVFKKIQKATSIVLIFLNKGILPFVVSEVFLMFTQITISSSISSTSLFIVTRFCHTRFPIYSNNMQFKWNFNATQILTGIVSYINIVSQLWQLAMFKILLKRDFNLYSGNLQMIHL